MTSNSLQVPRADLVNRPCCMVECGQRAQFWMGPPNTNGIDDYIEVCADHVDSLKQTSDVVVPL